MKKIIISILVIVSICNYSCRKEDNPILPELQGNIPVPKLVADPNSELVIDMTKDPKTFAGKFDVGLLYPNDKPQKMDIVVIKNGDKANVKTFKTDVAAFPTTLQITGDNLIDLFGPIVLGDYFDLAADVTLANGQKLVAFPSTGVQYAVGISAIPESAPLLRYSAICKFDADEYSGDFVVIEDEWADYAAGETVTLTKIDETHLSFLYKAASAKPIVLTITPTNAVIVNKQVYGNYQDAYGNYSVESTGDINDVVKPCDGTISVALDHSVSAGTFPGPYRITLKKK